ncbi:hypothetical protein GC105_03205 [Alkalibaculum sp. M08DMB]|uniref:Flagellar biosynthesis protein n=1 Tax=Alkalibaculum sporogenes TaxID=2655001 RepID=A0A6A7K5U5_9FIRM|nr:TIGR02530 family flagellar biosynthesis protein [Alkalibaculum sporogenes]MPW24798.1 hypothetical protein [Alkalibaculum sporogenes]
MSFRIENGQIISPNISRTSKSIESSNQDFNKILKDSISKKDTVRISNHAQQRMSERDIKLHETDMDLIKEAMDSLEKKGAKESLMIYKDVTFIANVRNRTIITALREKDMDVVTNIDSAIIVK